MFRRVGSCVALMSAFASMAACSMEPAEEDSSEEALTNAPLPAANAAPMLDAEEIAFVKALNDYRVNQPHSVYQYDYEAKGFAVLKKVPVKLSRLKVSIGLVKAARKHSLEMAARSKMEADGDPTDATHNDASNLKGDAMVQANMRILADYPYGLWDNGSTPGSGWGEDCARGRKAIGMLEKGADAFALMRTNMAEALVPWDSNFDGRFDTRVYREGFGSTGMPGDDPVPPNMLSHRAIGVARAFSKVTGAWYWTVTYGDYDDPQAPLLSADSEFESILSNGSFEEKARPDFVPLELNKPWNSPATWYPLTKEEKKYAEFDIDKTEYRSLNRWHANAPGGSIVIRTDNAFFDGNAKGASGLRIVDGVAQGQSASATQIVRALPGVNYELSFRARRVAGPSRQTGYLDFLDEKLTRIGVTTAAAPDVPGWTSEPTRVSATAPKGTAFVRIILHGSSAEGVGSTYDWDDVRLRAW